MKILNNIRYILFAILIVGSFANFAQNAYGYTIVVFSHLFLALVSFAAFVWLQRTVWKEKKITAILLTIFLLSIVFVVMIGPYVDNFDGIFLLGLLALLLLIITLIIIENRKKQEPSSSLLAFESLGLCFLFLGFYFRNMHWPGTGFLITSGPTILFFIYLPRALKMFIREFKKGKWISFLSFVFYLNIAIGAIGWLFKNQHWPFNPQICITTFILLITILILILSGIKFRYESEKISLGKYIGRINKSTIFLFVFLNYFSMYIALQVFGIGPRYYTLSNPPAYDKMRDKLGDNNPRAGEYWDNYDNFLSNRRDAENKIENK